MLIKNDEALERLGSPLNLLNRIPNSNSRNRAMNLFIPSQTKQDINSAFIPPTVDRTKDIESQSDLAVNGELIPSPTDIPSSNPNSNSNVSSDQIVEDADTKIKLALAHDQALGVLNNAIKMMGERLDDIDPEKLPSVINSTAKVVEGIRKERAAASIAKSGKDVHLHFYTPIQKTLTDYEIVEVG